jgi:hypothetical protein
MTTVQIVLDVPAELIERARAIGLEPQSNMALWIESLEERIRRREAGRELQQIAAEIQALPPEMRLTPEEIDAEIRAYWQEKEGIPT